MNSYIDELRELAKLKEDGIITEEEFQKKKEELLSESSNTEKTEIKSTLWICESCKKEIEEQFDACWNCGSVKSGNRKSNDKNDKISSDLSTLSETADENKTGNEQPLSQKYYVLKPYKGLAYLMMIVSTMYTIYSINHLIEASKAMKEYGGGASMDNAIIALVITYIITMFTLYCLTKIIDFLFDLDRKN